MHQRGEVDQLDDHGEVEVLRRGLATGMCGQQHQRGTDPLAIAVKRVADITRYAGIEFLHLKAKPLLDLVEIGLDGGQVRAEIELLRERGKGPMHRFHRYVTERERSLGFAHVMKATHTSYMGQTKPKLFLKVKEAHRPALGIL